MYYYVKNYITEKEEIRWVNDLRDCPHKILGRVPTFREHQALENIRNTVQTHLEKVL